MTCREFAEFLMAYFDGELPANQRTLFDEHLGECPDCVAFMQTYRDTVLLSKAAYTEAPDSPCEMPEDLLKAILASRPSGTP